MSKEQSIFSLIFGASIISNVAETEFSDEGKTEFREFKEFYNREIRKFATELEENRVTNLRKIIFHTRLLIVTSISYAAISLLTIPSVNSGALPQNFAEIISYIFVPIIAIAATMIWSANSKYNNAMKYDLFGAIFKFFEGFKYSPEGSDGKVYKKYDITPDYSFAMAEDLVTGSYKDISLRYEEVNLFKAEKVSSFAAHKDGDITSIGLAALLNNNLKVRTTSSYDKKEEIKRVFNGLILTLGFNKNFNGRTVIRKESGKIGNLLGHKLGNLFDEKAKDLKKVKLEDPVFEEMFEVYSEDQIEARYLLTTSFMERVKNLSDFFESSKVEAEFLENELFIMFRSKLNLFEPSSIFKEVNLIEECKTVISQLHLIFGVVEALKLNEKTGL